MIHSLNDEWNNFSVHEIKSEIPTTDTHTWEKDQIQASDLYISTKTKIAFLNIDEKINLENIYWNIPVISYHLPKNGIIKKQIKLTCIHDDDMTRIDRKLENQPIHTSKILLQTRAKTIRKINVGICKKDIISFRLKEKGVFYNSFAIVVRILYNGTFREIHVKLFNTGKMEIPGIQEDDLLIDTLDYLVTILNPLFKHVRKSDNDEDDDNNILTYNKQKIETVLINSNFNCGYYIDRDKAYQLFRNELNIISIYDPCSYPGIQCKFYYNPDKITQNGRCNCTIRCNKKNFNCIEVSFMIFRTGSILIVGHCEEHVIQYIYSYLINIFKTYYNDLQQGKYTKHVAKKKRINKKTIKVNCL